MKTKLKLYIIKPQEFVGYDEYDGCIVCAENSDEALTIAIDHCNWEGYVPFLTIDCTEIGIPNKNQIKGVIFTSFNAG